jgi:hypothetical protein
VSERYDCVLTLALPVALEEEVLDCLQAHPEWVSGFSIAHEEGYGSGSRLHSAMEKVRGRARRRLITVVTQRPHADALVAALRGKFHSPEMAYWMTPLVAFGRFV